MRTDQQINNENRQQFSLTMFSDLIVSALDIVKPHFFYLMKKQVMAKAREDTDL